MHPEPLTDYNGEVSDAPEHDFMLSNKKANKMSDALAIKQAKELRFSREELACLYGSDRD
jgi:hypothetical protein